MSLYYGGYFNNNNAYSCENDSFCFDESSRISTPVKSPLKEKNNRKNCASQKHVRHKDRPPQTVARRNARERRRVQAVNGAFLRLRKAVPIENARGKRVSKVKTLLTAIEYIQQLSRILQEHGSYGFSYDTKKYPQYKQLGYVDTVYYHNMHY